MASIDYIERIPNNVDLSENRRLLRALEDWQPKFLEWWHDMGPEGFQAKDVYLRTATSVDAKGWAQFGYVKMPEYRWGIFLAEPEALLQRRSGDHDKPRILGAFNEKTPDWLSFFMFCFFTDRDGKYQLACLAESGFDPLSRTCRFMLTEEAHHMFVGESGVGRIVQRACELMREHKTDDLRPHGGIDLPTIQRYLNFHCSVSLDLFGSEVSTNAANAFTMGLKGRFEETKKDDDHRLAEATYAVICLEGDRIITRDLPALTALNERLRDDYVADCERGVTRWNEIIKSHGID